MNKYLTDIISISNNVIIGQVDNELIGNHGFNLGSCIKFEKRHIYQIYDDDTVILQYMLANKGNKIPEDIQKRFEQIMNQHKLQKHSVP